MTEKPMTVAEVANFLRRSIKSVKRLPIPFSRVGKGRLYCCVLLAMPVGNRLLMIEAQTSKAQAKPKCETSLPHRPLASAAGILQRQSMSYRLSHS